MFFVALYFVVAFQVLEVGDRRIKVFLTLGAVGDLIVSLAHVKPQVEPQTGLIFQVFLANDAAGCAFSMYRLLPNGKGGLRNPLVDQVVYMGH